ncbi:MAG: class D beta-lactamase [Methylococcus sp.]|nr:class D beta-lactamase [Methylococcus sp.]
MSGANGMNMPMSLLLENIPYPCRGVFARLMQGVFAAAVLFACTVHAAGWKDSREVGDIFRQAGVQGTFVVYDVSAQTFTGHDRGRAETRFIPASTFKIPNTLIGLATGAVKSVDEVLPYGGAPQPFKTWEKDMGLREAIVVSNVPIYQELARRIGIERMKDYLSRLAYGNKEVGATVDNFWLVGPLKISAVEQTQFLASLAQDALPLAKDIQGAVREIVLLEQGTNWKLYGKTGLGNVAGARVGWWVGWAQRDDRVYAFALNIDVRNEADIGKRVELGKASLKALGLL